MKYKIVTGIEDSDAKGTTSSGTLFYAAVYDTELPASNCDTVGKIEHVTEDGKVVGFRMVERSYQLTTRFVWSLLDQVSKKVDPSALLAPYVAINNAQLLEAANAEAEAKKAKLAERQSAMKADPMLERLARQVLEGEQKAVAEYRAGKEKALNALVGRVMAAAKKEGQTPDAFAVSAAIKSIIVHSENSP